jgi:hypothetical protein
MIDSLSKTLGSDRYRVLIFNECRGFARKACRDRILYINVVSSLLHQFQIAAIARIWITTPIVIHPYRHFANMNRAKDFTIGLSAIGDVR